VRHMINALLTKRIIFCCASRQKRTQDRRKFQPRKLPDGGFDPGSGRTLAVCLMLHPQDRKVIESGLYPPEVVEALLYRIKRWGDYLRPQLSEEERAARLAELSEEEREVLRKRHYILGQIDRILLIEDEFLRKHKLGVDEVCKFFREHRYPVLPVKDLYNPIALAKISDCVLIGRVMKVKSHLEGPYHTWITVSVERHLKGGSGKKEVLVKLLSGPASDIEGSDGPTDISEPKFHEGEHVLLHLYSFAGRLHSYTYDRAGSLS